MAEELLEDRVKKIEETLQSLAGMPAQLSTLEGRVSALDGRVGKVELQIVQLRTEMRDGFSAVLEVVESSSKATQTLYDENRNETRTLFGDLKNEMRATRTQMRALHEDLVDRIKLLGSH